MSDAHLHYHIIFMSGVCICKCYDLIKLETVNNIIQCSYKLRESNIIIGAMLQGCGAISTDGDIKSDIALQNIRNIAPRVSLNLKGASLRSLLNKIPRKPSGL